MRAPLQRSDIVLGLAVLAGHEGALRTRAHVTDEALLRRGVALFVARFPRNAEHARRVLEDGRSRELAWAFPLCVRFAIESARPDIQPAPSSPARNHAHRDLAAKWRRGPTLRDERLEHELAGGPVAIDSLTDEEWNALPLEEQLRRTRVG